MNIDKDIADLLFEEAYRINSPDFIGADPVQFPRRFSKLQDIEIVALLAATIAWGNRKMICRDAEKLLALMEGEPFRYVMERGYEDLPDDMNIHRTFFARHLKKYLAGLRAIYESYGSLDDFAAAVDVGSRPDPAWFLVENMQRVFTDANGGIATDRCLPRDIRNTALKRINMALRWLVRDDGIVDLGVWHSIPKSKLYIPLDVHVGNTARNLGILTRKANDRRSVEELTDSLRTLLPEDPVLFDYALFGIGVEGRNPSLNIR